MQIGVGRPAERKFSFRADHRHHLQWSALDPFFAELKLPCNFALANSRRHGSVAAISRRDIRSSSLETGG
jgi:hypothetical protein